MSVQSDFRLRPLRGLCLGTVWAWLSVAAMGWGQTVDWGLQPPLPISETLDGESDFSLQTGTPNVGLLFHGEGSASLGPAVDLFRLLEEIRSVPVKENSAREPEVGSFQVGNASFKRAAESFNLGKTDDNSAKDDLSRQLGKVGGSPNTVTSIPLTGWAIGAVVVVAILIGMTIGKYENDRDDRHRRKKARSSRRRHHHSS